MSSIGTTTSRPVLFLAAMGYFGFLCLALIRWHLAPEVVLAQTIAGIGLVIMSLRPYLGLHVLIPILFVENALGSQEAISPMKVVGVVILLSWLVNVAMQRRTGLVLDGFTAALLLFLVWSGISLVYAIDTRVALDRTFQYAQYAITTLMFGSVVDTPARIHRVYWSFAMWATFHTVVAVAMYYLGMTPTASGLLINRNLLAIYINIAIVCAYILYQGTRSGLGRMVLITALPVLFLGIGLTFSRGGLISLALTLLVVWYRVARKGGFLLLAGSIGMIGLLTYVLPDTFWQRAESIVPAISRERDTFGARMKIWRVGVRIIEDRPVFGVGPGNFVKGYPRYARGRELRYQNLASHNAFIGMTAEHGLPGGALFLLLFGFAIRGARRCIRVGKATARSDLEILAVAVEVSLLALFIAGLSGDVYALKGLWMFFGLAVALERMAERAVAENRSRAAEGATAVPMEGLASWALARPRQ